LTFIAECIAFNTDAYLTTSDEKFEYSPHGGPVDKALLWWLLRERLPVEQLFIKRERECRRVAFVPFSADRRRMTVAYELQDGETKVRVVVKGAPEDLIPLCVSQKTSQNERIEFEGHGREGKEYLEKVVSHMASDGYSPICICYKDISVEDFQPLAEQYFNFESDESRAHLESNLCLVATFSFSDSLREDAKEIVGKL